MAHIHTEPGQHDHTVSIYLIRTDFSEPKIMLHFHSKIGAFAQFGGHVELHETPWQAAIHELSEETGYTMAQLQLLQPAERMNSISGAVIHPQPVAHATMGYPSYGSHFHTDSVYAFTAENTPLGNPREGESTDIRLFSRAEIAEQQDIDPITRQIALYILDKVFPNWEQVSPSEFQ